MNDSSSSGQFLIPSRNLRINWPCCAWMGSSLFRLPSSTFPSRIGCLTDTALALLCLSRLALSIKALLKTLASSRGGAGPILTGCCLDLRTRWEEYWELVSNRAGYSLCQVYCFDSLADLDWARTLKEMDFILGLALLLGFYGIIVFILTRRTFVQPSLGFSQFYRMILYCAMVFRVPSVLGSACLQAPWDSPEGLFGWLYWQVEPEGFEVGQCVYQFLIKLLYLAYSILCRCWMSMYQRASCFISSMWLRISVTIFSTLCFRLSTSLLYTVELASFQILSTKKLQTGLRWGLISKMKQRARSLILLTNRMASAKVLLGSLDSGYFSAKRRSIQRSQCYTTS